MNGGGGVKLVFKGMVGEWGKVGEWVGKVGKCLKDGEWG